MTKEQILEKITKEWKDSDVSPSRLASYLATIEERLEDNKTHIHCKVCDWSRRAADKIEDQLTTPTEGETKHRCSTKCRVDCKLRAPTPTPTECEHKHRGLYGECLKCTEKLDDSPTEVKDWEVRFEEEFGQYRYESVPKDMDVPVEKVKSFIRNLLK